MKLFKGIVLIAVVLAALFTFVDYTWITYLGARVFYLIFFLLFGITYVLQKIND